MSADRLNLLRNVIWISLALLLNKECHGNPDAKRLYDMLLRQSGYNKLIRPVNTNNDKLIVKLGLKLSQLIDVDEKNQIITTNVWLTQEWQDNNLRWNKSHYGGVERLYVPSDEIWLPDLVLYNNADGNYEVTLMTKATLDWNGLVKWEPPAIYKSSCQINVEFFPFDMQMCHLKFGSWTYDGDQVDLKHIWQELVPNTNSTDVLYYGIDTKDFQASAEWDILSVTAKNNEKHYTCCKEPYPDITFNITMRRKTLFHTVNLIIPSVAISFLTVLVFYLPSDSGEKIALCISILLSLTVFFLLLSEIIPPTSLVVPLIGKYLLFTMVLVTLSIIVTVIVLNVHFRSPSTHTMAPWVHKMFLQILPRLLLMKRPPIEKEEGEEEEKPMRRVIRTCNGIEIREGGIGHDPPPHVRHRDAFGSAYTYGLHEETSLVEMSGSELYQYAPAVHQAIQGVCYIADHLKDEDQANNVREDWKYVAMVLDRLFLWIFTTACVVGTCGIVLQAPSIYDNSPPLIAPNMSEKPPYLYLQNLSFHAFINSI